MAERERELPPLYDPRFEHDACGVGFVVDMQGRKSHAIVDQALTAVCCLNHRGAAGAEPDTGDGAGILDPDARPLLPRGRRTSTFPPPGAYATGIAFLPRRRRADATKDDVAKVLADEGFDVLGWRDVPVDAHVPGKTRTRADARVRAGVRRPRTASPATISNATSTSRASASSTRPTRTSRRCSARVVVYKGMLTPDQLARLLSRPRRRAVRERARRSCTRASARTRSRSGRSRTRTACSPTTARSTPCRATRTGCAPAKA